MSDKFISLDSLKEYNKQMKETYIKPLNNKIDEIVADLVGKTDYLGTVSSMAELSTTAGAGDCYRVSTEFVYDKSTGEKAHVGDILIAVKSNPTQNEVDWDLVHAELDNDTWTANTAVAAGYVEKGEGQVNKVWMTDENGNPSWRKIGNYNIKSISDTNDYHLLSITFSDKSASAEASATLFGPTANSINSSDPTGVIPTSYLSTDYFKVNGLHATEGIAVGYFGLATSNPKAVYTATTISIQSSDSYGNAPTTKVLTIPKETGTLATQEWTNTHYYPDLVISTATEVNSDIQKSGNSIIFYEPTMGSESYIYRTAADEYLHFSGGDGVIFHGDIEVEQDIYEKCTALKDKYISCQEIPWSEFITKVINTNMQPPICMIDISNATHMSSYYKDSKKKKWIDLDTFKNGSLQIPKAELSDEWIEEGNYMVGTTNWGYLYIAFRGTYITYEILDTNGKATFERQNSTMNYDPDSSSDWKMPVISVGIR